MAQAEFKIVGKAPLLFGQAMSSRKAEQESDIAFEDRCWRERAHQTEDGQLYIPAMALKRMLEGAAKRKGEKLPGRKTFTKIFESGIAVFEDGLIDKTISDANKLPRFVPSDGKKGGGKRVWRNFPMLVTPWTLSGSLIILDGMITREVLERHLTYAGIYCGLGMWRPSNAGMYGRFTAEVTGWARDEYDPPAAEHEVEVKSKRKVG